MLTAAVLLIIFFGLMIIGVPIGYSMLITATVTLKFIHTEIPTIIIPQRIFGGVNNYILLCIPFFMLAGELMAITTLFDRLLKCANALVGGGAQPCKHRGQYVLCRYHRCCNGRHVCCG